MPKLTTLADTTIKHAKPRTKEYSLSAGMGLHLRVSPTGTKTWLFNYIKPHTRKRTNLSVGQYPAVSLSDARAARDRHRALLAKRLDPQEDAKAARDATASTMAMTFESVYRKWLPIKQSVVSENYLHRIDAAMKLHVMPELGQTPLAHINAPHVIQALQPLALRRNLETVRKICGWLNEVMVQGVNTGLIHANPLAKILSAFEAPKRKNYPCIKPHELPKFMADLEEASITFVTRAAIEWLLHTLLRPGEAVSTEWAEVDEARALLTIPAAKMKMRRDHLVPLPPQALMILARMKPLSGRGQFVFPSSIHPGKHLHPETPNSALKNMGYKNRMVAHGIRSLGSTTLNEQRFHRDLIEVSLAHIDSSIRGDYNRADYVEGRREMMTWWSDWIDAARSAPCLPDDSHPIILPSGYTTAAQHLPAIFQ